MAIPKKEKPNVKKIALIAIGVAIGIILFNLLINNTEIDPQVKKENVEELELQGKHICINPTLPEKYINQIKDFDTEKDIKIKTEYSQEECSIIVNRNVNDISQYERLWTKIYVLASRFDSEIENITSRELEEIVTKMQYKNYNVIWDENTNEFLQSTFNMGVGHTRHNQEEIKEEIIEGNAIAIIPFDKLIPIYKTISIDNFTPKSKELNESTYILADSYYISKNTSPLKENISKYMLETLGENKYEKEEIKIIITTGSSLVGQEKQQELIEENNDKTYPLKPIISLLTDADISHISNKKTFTPNSKQTANSIQMITEAGINVVGVTGEHIVDHGGEAFRHTLNLYNQNNITYFGAGNNEQEAFQPKIIELGDMKIAFLGYSGIPPQIYWALGQRGGSASLSNLGIQRSINQAKELADFIIVEMQCESQEQQELFGKIAIDSGANIVIGVNSQTPDKIEYYKNGMIFHNLGAFLNYPNGREPYESILVQHIFYKKNYIGYNIIPLEINQNLQIDLASTKKRYKILEEIFKESKIDNFKK